MPEFLPAERHSGQKSSARSNVRRYASKVCIIECQKLCQNILQRIRQVECQKICQIAMPEDMRDKMPEGMSDRMPEDLPVTKRINVMAGITRSKVICFSAVYRKAALDVSK